MSLHQLRPLAVASLLLFLGFAAQADIVIGQSAPLSKANVSLGTDIRDGALAWFRKVNEGGGVNGQRVRLVTLDDENSALRAVYRRGSDPRAEQLCLHAARLISRRDASDPHHVERRRAHALRGGPLR